MAAVAADHPTKSPKSAVAPIPRPRRRLPNVEPHQRIAAQHEGPEAATSLPSTPKTRLHCLNAGGEGSLQRELLHPPRRRQRKQADHGLQHPTRPVDQDLPLPGAGRAAVHPGVRVHVRTASNENVFTWYFICIVHLIVCVLCCPRDACESSDMYEVVQSTHMSQIGCSLSCFPTWLRLD